MPHENLYSAPEAETQTRWATAENPDAAVGAGGKSNYGAKGRAYVSVPAGGAATLLDYRGAGTITRIWITIRDRSPEMLRGLILEMFWDDAKTPAVSAPLGDFFGAMLGELTAGESALFANPEGRSLLTYIPMPFRSAARITLTNTTAAPVVQLFYEVDFLAQKKLPDDARYFHAQWRREELNALGENFVILPRVVGAGRFLGCIFGVRVNPQYQKTWWGEGEMKIFRDGVFLSRPRGTGGLREGFLRAIKGD